MTRNTILLVACGILLGLSIGLMLNPLTKAHAEPQIAVWLEVVHRVCTSIGGLGTCGALIYLVRQFQLMSQQSDLLQKNIHASIDSALYNRLDSFNRFIVEHHKIYDRLSGPFNAHDPLETQAKLHHLCDLGFTFYEEVYKNHIRYGLMHQEDWDEWRTNLVHFFGKPYVRGYWKRILPRFSRSFQELGNQICETTPEDPVSPGDPTPTQ